MILSELAMADKRPVRFLNHSVSCSAINDGSAKRSCVRLEKFEQRGIVYDESTDLKVVNEFTQL